MWRYLGTISLDNSVWTQTTRLLRHLWKTFSNFPMLSWEINIESLPVNGFCFSQKERIITIAWIRIVCVHKHNVFKHRFYAESNIQVIPIYFIPSLIYCNIIEFIQFIQLLKCLFSIDRWAIGVWSSDQSHIHIMIHNLWINKKDDIKRSDRHQRQNNKSNEHPNRIVSDQGSICDIHFTSHSHAVQAAIDHSLGMTNI